jgi:hypothetical protein
MKKKIIALAAIVLLMVLFVPSAVHAVGGIMVTSDSAAVSFPDSITFNISAQDGANINDIRLHYTVERIDFAKITSEIFIDFTPAASIKQQYIMDMRKTGGFPPGTNLDYWWTLTDASGASLTTTSKVVHFNDGRYDWKTSQKGMVTLYWYNGDASFAGELMDTTQQALGRLSDNTGAALKNNVSIYIYANSNDLLGSMIFPQDWTGGVAFTEYGVIAIGIATDTASLNWGKGAIAHELTHLVVHQVTLNPYNGLPTWLDEGLAMYSEGPLDIAFTSALYAAEKNETLISIRSLTSPFSANANLSVLSYAESYEIVYYLINHYGRDKMLKLLNVFAQGSSYDDALKTVYSFDMDGLNTEWQAQLLVATVG